MSLLNPTIYCIIPYLIFLLNNLKKIKVYSLHSPLKRSRKILNLVADIQLP